MIKLLKLSAIIVIVFLAIQGAGIAVFDWFNRPPENDSVVRGVQIDLTVDDLLKETNRLRPKELILDAGLNKTAAAKCREIVNTDRFEHGDDWAADMEQLGRRIYGENLATDYRTSKTVVDAWVKSKTHYANIIDPDFGRVGFAICYEAPDWPIVVQHFSD